MAVLDPLTSRFSALRNYTGQLAWAPLASLSRSAVLSLLSRIQTGRLDIVDVDGSETICGSRDDKDPGPRTALRVHSDAFWVRLALFADMGFAESFMLNEVSCPNLTAFFDLFIMNRAALFNGSTLTSSLAGTLAGLARRANTLQNSRLNIAAHYDISNEMFAAFLSPDMTYSCPIWLPLMEPASALETLEDAQMRKLDRFIDNAKLKSSDHVLEIGTGWGSLAIRAVARTGCRITSLTLSVEQKELAEDRIREAGLQDRIQVLLCDYRNCPLPDDRPAYDKLISIEMLEAVGPEFLVTYFKQVDRLLKKEGGIAVFQCITMPETVSSLSLSPFPSPLPANTPLSATTPTPPRTTSSGATSSPAGTSPRSPNSSPPSTRAAPNASSSTPSRTSARTTPKRCGCGGRASSTTSTPASGPLCSGSTRA